MVGQMYRHRSDILIVQGRSCPGVQRWSHQSIFTTSTWHDDETTTEWWHYKTLWYIYMTLWHCNNNNKIWHNNDITWHLQYVTMTICPWHYDNASRLHTVTSNYTGGMLTGWRHNHDCGWSVERAAAAAGAVQWLVAGLVPAKHYIIIQSQHWPGSTLPAPCTYSIATTGCPRKRDPILPIWTIEPTANTSQFVAHPVLLVRPGVGRGGSVAVTCNLTIRGNIMRGLEFKLSCFSHYKVFSVRN